MSLPLPPAIEHPALKHPAGSDSLVFTSPFPASCQSLITITAGPIAKRQLAPTGKLRVVINSGNYVLTNKSKGKISGISLQITNLLAKQLGASIQSYLVPSAGLAYQIVASGRADIGFFGIAPQRADGSKQAGAEDGVSFSNPYISILGSYVVKKNSPITKNSQVDQPGNVIVVGKNSVYNLWLDRHIRYASIVQAPTSPLVSPYLLRHEYMIGAGIRNQLESDASKYKNLRVLDGHFMIIKQAIATPNKHRQSIPYLNQFISDLHRSGCLSGLAKSNNITGYSIPY
ncbi:transporter substrate-binding domain-containing protein [Cyanobium sp. HWJ4-Hawea]|uniref:transporter substrate-binding domain-containing protein n=1 Tax=unclassified Cyanobium TaxID=2627006 RepID=UPI0020CC0026|nr:MULTISPECIES: transporter substrate-binding domain-containing protein [unclassified Cyanobium]MCP9775895.1 transporter substrate-binding domain-containing protein [Cyanobium sp. WAJ14-Wanaka]MCP9808765.1 transporter substrate-binding domain-containing protein [Cyanobium sp. HWJ4-Hawea]